jgi:hypothetical protein
LPRPSVTKDRPYTPKSGQLAGRTFHTEREYRNALAQLKGHRNWYAEQKAEKKVTAMSFAYLTTEQKHARKRALNVLSLVRRGHSLTEAAKLEHTTPNTVRRYVDSVLERDHSGRVKARKSDRLHRAMLVATTDGIQELEVRGSGRASVVSEHWTAIRVFLASGDEAPLQKLEGEKVAGKQLETDPERIEELQRVGQLEFESIYQSSL